MLPVMTDRSPSLSMKNCRVDKIHNDKLVQFIFASILRNISYVSFFDNSIDRFLFAAFDASISASRFLLRPIIFFDQFLPFAKMIYSINAIAFQLFDVVVD